MPGARALQTKTARSPAPSRKASSPPTPTVLDVPVSSFTFTFTLTGGPSLLPSLFSTANSNAALVVSEAIDTITPVQAIVPANITLVASLVTGTCQSSTACTLTLTYQVNLFYTTVANGMATSPSAAYTLIQGYFKYAFSSTCATKAGPTAAAETCFLQALVSGITGPLKRVSAVSLVTTSFSPLTNTLPSALTNAPTPTALAIPTAEPTPTSQPSFFQARPTQFPTMTNTLTEQTMPISFVVHYNWGLAGCQPVPPNCVGSNCIVSGASACYTLLTQLIASSIANGQLVQQIAKFAKMAKPPVLSLQSVTNAGNLNFPACTLVGASTTLNTDLGPALCNQLYTFMPTAMPTPTPTIQPSTIRPTIQVGLASLAQRQGLTSSTLPMIGGVVGAAVLVLIGLAIYMRHRSNKNLEEGEEMEEIHGYEDGQEHFDNGREPDDFRVRESGGVDVLFNPAHQQYYNGGGGDGGGGGDDGASVVSGMYPPSLPPLINRRITLTRPAQQLAQQLAQQQHAGPPQNPQTAPAARRITIIAKPPMMGAQSNMPAPSMGGSPRMGTTSIRIQDEKPPSPGTMRPIGRFGGVTVSQAERESFSSYNPNNNL